MLGRAVFPGALIMGKRGTYGEFRENSLVGGDGLVCALLVPCVRPKGRSAETLLASVLASVDGTALSLIPWFPFGA